MVTAGEGYVLRLQGSRYCIYPLYGFLINHDVILLIPQVLTIMLLGMYGGYVWLV